MGKDKYEFLKIEISYKVKNYTYYILRELYLKNPESFTANFKGFILNLIKIIDKYNFSLVSLDFMHRYDSSFKIRYEDSSDGKKNKIRKFDYVHSDTDERQIKNLKNKLIEMKIISENDTIYEKFNDLYLKISDWIYEIIESTNEEKIIKSLKIES